MKVHKFGFVKFKNEFRVHACTQSHLIKWGIMIACCSTQWKNVTCKKCLKLEPNRKSREGKK